MQPQFITSVYCSLYRGDAVLAVASMARDPVAACAANRMFVGKMPSATEIRYM